MGYVHGEVYSHYYNNVYLHLYMGLDPNIKVRREKPLTKDQVQPNPSFLSGEWSPFIDEGESTHLVIFQCGTLCLA